MNAGMRRARGGITGEMVKRALPGVELLGVSLGCAGLALVVLVLWVLLAVVIVLVWALVAFLASVIPL